MSKREEAAFLRGEIGVDGQAVEEQRDEGQVEKDRALQQLLRGRTYLGREFLTWLLWRTNAGGPIIDIDDQPVTALFVGTLSLRGLGGDATEVSVKGALSAYSPVVRAAIGRGLLVHSARLRLQHGERAYEATIDAEHLTFRSCEIPKVLSEEDDERIQERLYLSGQITGLVDGLFNEFLQVRSTRRWKSKVVPSMLEWIQEVERA